MSEWPLQDVPIELYQGGTPDELFASKGYPKPFRFNAEVAAVFDDMVNRSVPMYQDVIRSVCAWTTKFYQPGTAIYDIGCSTGTTLRAIGETLRANDIKAQLVGIDPSQDMLDKAETKLAPLEDFHHISLEATAAQDAPLQRCSVVTMNYTLQFLPIADRRLVLKKIADRLVPGGILLLSEKIRFASPEFQEVATTIYEQHKQRNGYTSTEIARKKEALENVLVPLTLSEQTSALEKAGFDAVAPLMQWHNFVTLIAQKND